MADKERLEKLRLLVETQAEVCLSMIDGLLAECEDEADVISANPPLCQCGESDSDKIEDTTDLADDPRKRLTCLSCGVSWYSSTALPTLTAEVPING